MDKSKFQPKPPAKNPIFEKIFHGSTQPAEDSIQKLFLLVEEGNIFKIKDYLANNNLTTGIRSEKSDTLLHVVLSSSNLTPENKYLLADYLVNSGAPIDLPNSSGITPLHLSAKLQLEKITKLLIDAGANINYTDNQNMTPLHYQVMGESSECKLNKTTKPGDLIKSTNNLTSRDNLPSEFDEINNAISGILYSDLKINVYLTHFRNTLKSFHNMFPNETKQMQSEYLTEITNILSNIKMSSDDKYGKLSELATTNVNKIVDFLKNKTKVSTGQLNISPNLTAGWAPNSEPDVKIIGSSINDIFNGQYKTTLGTTEATIGAMLKTVDSINDDIFGRTSDGLYDIFQIWKLNIQDICSTLPAGFPPVGYNIQPILFGPMPHTIPQPPGPPSVYFPDINLHLGTFITWPYLTGLPNMYKVVTNNMPGWIIPYFFISDLGTHISNIVYNSNIIIRRNISDLQAFLSSGVLFSTWDALCSNIYTGILNICLFISAISNSLEHIRNKFSQLLAIEPGASRYYTPGDVDTDIADITKLLKSLYTKTTDLVPQLNIIVDAINRRNALRYIYKYHDLSQDINFLNQDTSLLSELYDRPLNKFKTLPDFTNFVQEFAISYDYDMNSLVEVKKKIFTQCLNQINYLNHGSFYRDLNLNIQSPRGGDTQLIATDMLLVPRSFALAGSRKYNSMAGHLMALPNLGFTHLAPIPLELTDNTHVKFYSKDPDGKLDLNPSIAPMSFGYLGMEPSIINKKNLAAFPVIGSLLDTHLEIIKQLIVQYCINQLANPIDPNQFTNLVEKYIYFKYTRQLALNYIPFVQAIRNEITINLAPGRVWNAGQTSDNIKDSIRIAADGTGFLPKSDCALIGRYAAGLYKDTSFDNLSQLIANYENKQKIELGLDNLSHSITYSIVAKLIDTQLGMFINTCIYEAASVGTLNMIKDTEQYATYFSDILKKIRTDMKTLVMIPQKSYKVNLADTYSMIIDNFFTNKFDKQISMLNYAGLLVSGQDIPDPTQHILYNYSFISKSYENKCYNINPSITQLLISNGARLNEKDIMGNTPLAHAIDNQNTKIIDILINSGASIDSQLSTNSIGVTPLTHSLKLYKAHLDIFSSLDELTGPIYKKLDTIIKNKPEYSNNMIVYGANIFPELILILNHQFYLDTLQYKNHWAYEDQEKLLKYFTNTSKYPILDYNFTPNTEGLYGIPTLRAHNTHLQVIIDKNKAIREELTGRRDNLQKERVAISGNLADPYYQTRDQEISLLARDITNEIIKLDRENKSIINKLSDTKKADDKFGPLSTTKFQTRKTAFVNKTFTSSTKLYDEIFAEVINDPKSKSYNKTSDFTGYLVLWNEYLQNKTSHNNPTQLHIQLSSMQNISLSNYLDTKNNITELKDIITISSKIYTSIISKYARDYDDLPLVYNPTDNYALSNVLDIITHVTRHNLCGLFYSSIIKILSKYVSTTLTINMVNAQSYNEYVLGVVENIMGGTTKKTDLANYIMGKMPNLLVKSILGIYKDDYDPDRTINSDTIFANIINILQTNITLPMSPDNIFITQLKTELVPYYKDIFEIFIKESKNLMDNYMRYLVNESRHIQIVGKLLNQ